MRAQPRQLLGDVALFRPHRDLGENAPFVDADALEQRLDALAQPLLAPGCARGRALRHRVDVSGQLDTKGTELRAKRGAFRHALREERVDRAPEHGVERRPQRLRVGHVRLFEAHDARPLEHPRERDVTGEAELRRERPRPLRVFAREGGIDRDALERATGAGAELDVEIDPPALEPLGQHAPHARLETGERARQADREIEMAVIHRARLGADRAEVGRDFGATEPRHAADHRREHLVAATGFIRG